MRSGRYLWENVVMNIYRQMYKEATPPADFDKLLESGETKKEGWFEKYYLPAERQNEIYEYWCNKFKCDKYEREKISFEVFLGAAPSCIKKEKKH